MASDVPAFLEVGTPVSAKFKGAFCEAAIKSVKKSVKFKVLFKDGSGSTIVNNELIEGDYKLNGLVLIKQDDREGKPATIQKMNDLSLYTVVFDDGDERTLRRTNVCVMGERHFQEHENLDNLPLTDPENFLSPVVLSGDKRRKRRRSAATLEEEDSDSDGKRWNSEQDKEFLGKVVCIEQGERKKSWFPALGVKHFGTHSDSQVFVQSFKDGKRLLVNREDVKEFSKVKEPLSAYLKGETKTEPILKSAIEKALAYHDMGELPKGWNILDTIDEKEESSDEDLPLAPVLSSEAKAFQDAVYVFMNKQGSPITKPPLVNNQGINLHKLFKLVAEIGGFEEVTNQQWRNVYKQLGLRNIHTTASYNMKTIYKRYLLPYEENNKNRASPSRQAKLKGKKSVAAAIKDEADKSSNKSESDSEPERRRSTRGTARLSNIDRTPELSERKRRSNVTTSVETSLDESPPSSSEKESKVEAREVKLSEMDDVDIINSPESSTTSDEQDVGAEKEDEGGTPIGKYKPGAKISVRYGSGKNQRTYNAKILEADKDDTGDVVYYIHYNGWNHRYDEWIKEERVFALSGNTPNKQRKNLNPPASHHKIAKDPPQRYKTKVKDEESSESKKSQKKTSTSPTTSSSTSTASSPASIVGPTIEATTVKQPTLPTIVTSPVVCITSLPSSTPIATTPLAASTTTIKVSSTAKLPPPPSLKSPPPPSLKLLPSPSLKSPPSPSLKSPPPPSLKSPPPPSLKSSPPLLKSSPSLLKLSPPLLKSQAAPLKSPAAPSKEDKSNSTDKSAPTATLTLTTNALAPTTSTVPILPSTPVSSITNSTGITSHRLSRLHHTQPLTVKCGRLSGQVTEKLPSPLKSPAIPPDAVFLAEPLKSQNPHYSKHHRPKPVNDALFIPDIKPSPVKPRMTRNSMQDTFLLNALEESIGKQNQAAMVLQQDILLKSEPPTLSRRRSNRQNPSPKSEPPTDSDFSSREDIKDNELSPAIKENTLLLQPVKSEAVEKPKEFVLSPPPPLEAKETFKEVNVKKWIEDSSIIMSKSEPKTEETIKEEPLSTLEETPTSTNDEKANNRRGRKSKTKKTDAAETRGEKRRKAEDSDSEEAETKSEPANEVVAVVDDVTTTPAATTTIATEVVPPNDNENNNVITEKDRASETTDALSDFCNIIGNVPKLQSHESIDSTISSTISETKSHDAALPTKEHLERRKSRGERCKRRRTLSTNEEDLLKSPNSKKEKQMSPPLDYNPDFVSDLDSALAEKSSVDRITIMQSRLNAMRKLYCKLRQEVASIDRRKRRKLRKQLETKAKVLSL